MATAPLKGSGGGSTVLDCDPTVAVGDYVAIGPAGVAVAALASDPLRMPCIGRVLSKAGSVKCTVTEMGYEGGTGFVVKKPYFVSATQPGKLQVGVPIGPAYIVQNVAEGVSPTSRLFRIDPSDFRVRASS